jgi:hypothetical protein
MLDCGSCLLEPADLDWMDEIFILVIASHSEVHHHCILTPVFQ